MAHYVYILYSKSADRFYIGETCNIEQRIQQHNTRFYKSAFSKKAVDWKLFWSIECKSKTQALRIEKYIKKMRNRTFYQNLIKYPEMTEKLQWEELSRCQIGTLNKVRGSNIKYLPFAFTELVVSMLSSVINSKTAIEINRNIMRAFVAVRQLILAPPTDRVAEIENEIKKLKEYIEEVFSDYNDINEDTHVQLELINQTLAELQANRSSSEISRQPIGFRKPTNNE